MRPTADRDGPVLVVLCEDAAPGGLASQLADALVCQHVLRIFSVLLRLEEAVFIFQAEDPVYLVVQLLLGNPPFQDEGANGLYHFLHQVVLRLHEHQVCPGLQGQGAGIGHAVAGGDGPHGHAVGGDHALEAQLLPQQPGNHLSGDCGDVVRVDGREDAVGNHDGGQEILGDKELPQNNITI